MLIPRRALVTDPAIISRFNRGVVAQSGVIPENMRFLQDTYPLKVLESKQVVSESISEAAGRVVKALQITGIFQKADDCNQNGREYPLEVITQAVSTIKEDIIKRGVMGEFDHPTDAKIHLERVSHIITKLWMEGKYVYGVAEVLEEMPCGAMLKTLLKNRVQVGISSRGVGDMEEIMAEGRSRFRVQPGYQFVTWDIVGEPSVSDAIMHVMESKNRLITRNDRPAALGGMFIRELAQWLNQNKLQ